MIPRQPFSHRRAFAIVLVFIASVFADFPVIAASKGGNQGTSTAAKKSPPKPKSWTPFRLSALPPPSPGFPRTSNVRGLSLGLMVSHDDEAYGIQIAPIPSVDRGTGLQLGAASDAGRFTGIQVSLLSASCKTIDGVQASPVNNLDFRKTRLRGIQLGAFNGAGDMRGLQVGAGNRCLTVRGFQAGAINNCRSTMRGLQIGAVNASQAEVRGVQVGVFNSCRSLAGVQIGLLNRVSERRFLWGTLPLLNAGW